MSTLFRTIALGLGALGALACAAPASAHAQNTQSTQNAFDSGAALELVEQLRPSEADLWRQVPWKISVLDGQRAAGRADKPLFIWAMDGHPLGCT